MAIYPISSLLKSLILFILDLIFWISFTPSNVKCLPSNIISATLHQSSKSLDLMPKIG
jgi:hypothetical protein